MDAVQRSFNLFIDGGRGVFADLLRLYNDFDFRKLDTENVSLYLLLTVVTGFIAVVAYAQLTGPDMGTPAISTINAALGPSSDIVHRPGDPPLPPQTQVVSLRIYPIKSCRGFEVDSTRLKTTGLTLDRNWLLVDEKKEFLTIRSDARMTLIKTAIVNGEKDKLTKDNQYLEVSRDDTKETVKIPAFPTEEWLKAKTKLITVSIWGAETDAYEYDDSINQWFTAFFERPVSLVFKGPTKRMLGVNGRPELYGREQNHNFADVFSLQVASTTSMDDLNKRLQGENIPELSIERFRPNIIVRGTVPWEEDGWKRIRITTRLPDQEMLYRLDLDVPARCLRCLVPTVDPDTAEKLPKLNDELMRSRRIDQGLKYKAAFGMMAVSRQEGIISVGATVDVLEMTNKHLYNKVRFADL